jgi:hypothetical protein
VLYADALELDPESSEEGVFHLDVDGQEHALSFHAAFPLQGGAQRAIAETRPRIRLQARPDVRADQPARLLVGFTVDNAPPNARLECRLGHADGSTWSDDVSPWTAPAKRSSIGFTPRGEAGAWLFEATLSNWDHAFEVAGIRGRRWLVARLVDPAGLPIGEPARLAVVLDDLPPRDIAFESLPTEVPKGTTNLRVSAVVAMPASLVKELTFFVGNPADFEKAAGAGLTVRGRPIATDPHRWEGTLTLPATPTDPLVLGVRVVSGVELVGFARPVEIRVGDPLPTAEMLKARKEAELSKPGIIQGKVSQSNLPQPNLTITLTDLKPKVDPEAKAVEVKTGKDGTFTFKDVKPGKYRVSAANVVTRTRADKDVTLEPGKTEKIELELFR